MEISDDAKELYFTHACDSCGNNFFVYDVQMPVEQICNELTNSLFIHENEVIELKQTLYEYKYWIEFNNTYESLSIVTDKFIINDESIFCVS